MGRGGSSYFAGKSIVGNARKSRAQSEVSRSESEVASSRAASEMYGRMKDLEPGITSNMKQIEQLTGGKLVGLNFRLKDLDSLTRKIKKDVAESNGKLTPEEAAANIADGVRFTLQFNDEDYTAGVQRSLDTLKSQGYEILAVKNFWQKGDPYQGINVKLRRDGVLTELQFHTPESHHTKETRLHDDYKIYRDKTLHSEADRKAAYERMVAAADRYIPDPKDLAKLLTIGTMAYQTFG